MQWDSLAWLALALTPGLERRKAWRLCRRLGSPRALLELGEKGLCRYGFARRAARRLAGGESLERARRCRQRCPEQGIRCLVPDEREYPPLLRQTADPPLTLFCRGRLELLGNPAVAVVGSRRCSEYGRRVTASLCRALVRSGLGVVSGLARGVDAAAHRAALEEGGQTVAVLGCGVDVLYPRENRDLFERIAREGCLVSEFPPGTFPLARHFPLRNRIISGLTLGTLVTEAARSSGSLITAGSALNENREVWAVPGDITRETSEGTNALLAEGAHLVTGVEDLLRELPLDVLEGLRRGAPARPGAWQ